MTTANNLSNNNLTGIRIKALRKAHKMTLEEVGKILGVQKAAVQKYENGTVRNIKRASLIKLAETFNTTVEYLLGLEETIKESEDQIIKIPVLAKVSAGLGAFADSLNNTAIGYETLVRNDISDAYNYAFLKVSGDSMQPLFNDGDLVLVRCQSFVDNGSFAVVMIDNESGVIKQFHRGAGYIELRSLNPDYPPRRFEKEEMSRIRIFGLVKELRRKF